ncbi:sugar ABC transporter substrate-binding protein, partial [Streptomyces sp. SID11233]|nr:sugar ABC transporter substrate-binding protein [Streptomyces sp. SID11233]
TFLNKTWGSVPPVKDAQEDPAFNKGGAGTIKETLLKSATALPQVPNEAQFETAVGTAIKDLWADAAGKKEITTADVKAALTKAEQQMPK